MGFETLFENAQKNLIERRKTLGTVYGSFIAGLPIIGKKS